MAAPSVGRRGDSRALASPLRGAPASLLASRGLLQPQALNAPPSVGRRGDSRALASPLRGAPASLLTPLPIRLDGEVSRLAAPVAVHAAALQNCLRVAHHVGVAAEHGVRVCGG